MEDYTTVARVHSIQKLCQWVTGTKISTKDLNEIYQSQRGLVRKEDAEVTNQFQGWNNVIATSKWQTRETVN